MKPIRLMRGFLTVGGWTLMSRVLGFVRDALIAAYLGAGPAAEAFVVAFSLPNMFRRFFAEGTLNVAFVPMFAKKVEAGEDARGFAEDTLSALAGMLLVLTIASMIFMPLLVSSMAAGFIGDSRFDLAVHYGRITFPYVLFISLGALFSGILNATGRFAAAAAAPVMLNIILSIAMVGAHIVSFDVATALVWAVPVAGIAQLSIVWIVAKRAGFSLVPRLPRMTPELKALFILAGPAALAGGVVQINLLVGRQVASFAEAGALQYLNLADRLYQLPLGVVAIAIGVVLLPDLSRRLQAGDSTGARRAYNRAFEFALLLTIPAAVALIVMPQALIGVLFQRGAFSVSDAQATAMAVAIYGLGLPAFVIQKVLQPLYFAREDTKTPFRFAVYSMVVNAGLAIGLSFWIGYLAAAVATSLAAWSMVILLWVGKKSMGDDVTADAQLRHRTPRILIAAIAMGGILYAAQIALAPLFDVSRLLATVMLIILGIISYFGIGQAIGALNLRDIKSSVKRGG
ncbi:murein biosynthesis integral membrane protein MurJ [Pacificibacter marinus]|uniref:Probable lipid II flippase MurJ n=1 Tax=Pacificibacter marinus TaxID=658057 RepID=A0A1Y5SDL1_9RHOB|nr:murein biosynthesis integral membrane protein MurJ [Pacificibacter marinus]SEK49915.1 putative peptidoglycan lipid II flippase [Pacificibacter marinus]SLN37258.1 putative peptidoglycan biosynthesis protein MurJ [Pacificibacter marinus]